MSDVQIIHKRLADRACDYCSAPATYRNTYLNDGERGARHNPASSAFGRDDCTWCSDFDDYLCAKCHERDETDNVPDGFGWCSTFEKSKFPKMFKVWVEEPLDIYETLVQARILALKWCHYQGNTQALWDKHIEPIDNVLKKIRTTVRVEAE